MQTDVLHNVSFSVGEGEMMAIVGSSGSGKAPLLHLLKRRNENGLLLAF